MRSVLPGLTAVLLAASGAAHAQSPGPGPANPVGVHTTVDSIGTAVRLEHSTARQKAAADKAKTLTDLDAQKSAADVARDRAAKPQ